MAAMSHPKSVDPEQRGTWDHIFGSPHRGQQDQGMPRNQVRQGAKWVKQIHKFQTFDK